MCYASKTSLQTVSLLFGAVAVLATCGGARWRGQTQCCTSAQCQYARAYSKRVA